ncbi:glucose dehydrogenase [FAD, quinone]-like [Sabethes cyaneus]|uniref:glucose dehydrogenase [FAD, quinone]-like n=1 Tax=Sabethes cyaneus TaxID=53552 RepID=UPI00237DF668|nr:glucose dehydrogenase [FAD, quinone]-like [Sabethes cyaneus]
MTVAGLLPILLAIGNEAPLSVIDSAFNNFNAEYLYGSATAQIPDTVSFNAEYDFIIVGAGIAGCVIANRLTENPQWNVLLLEAGKEENIIFSVPLAQTLTLQQTAYVWNYYPEPMTKSCAGLLNGVCRWPRGVGLGGCSLINGMIYTRGHEQDFNNWSQAGNYGWSFSDVLPYFHKAENSYVQLSQNPYETKVLSAFVQTLPDFGYHEIDPNDSKPIGFYKLRSTTVNGQRYSASRYYLHPVRNRLNLHISVKSFVTKILINPKTKIAYGVEFEKNNRCYRIFARKEVILSAGSLSSPKLLMLSGIGPKEHLESLSIPVIKSLDVGYNLHDHNLYPNLTFFPNQPITMDLEKSTAQHFADYIANGTGPFSIPGRFEAISFLKTSDSFIANDYPDVELLLASASINRDDSSRAMEFLGLTEALYNANFAKSPDNDNFSFYLILLHPKSRGRLLLKSRNPFEQPQINANYFDVREDLETFVKGLKLASFLGESQYFAEYGSKLSRAPVAGCENHLYGSDGYWECCIRQFATTTHHQSGTCKMGPASDRSAVVDPTLQVYGIQGLRVVDASIIPQPMAGHPMGVLYMIGEKVSDIIKQSWPSERIDRKRGRLCKMRRYKFGYEC